MKVDVHAHLDYPLVGDINEVVENAKKAGVSVIINNGLNPKSNRKTMMLSKNYDIIKPALGIYPTDAVDMSDEEIEKELIFIKTQRPIAIGECGLDFSDSNLEAQEKQIIVFKKLIEIAKSLDVPIIVHSRKAEFKVLEIIEEMQVKKVVLHCFSGKKVLIQNAVKLGCNFSIPANVTRSQHFQDMVRDVPITQILTETDTPFLGPEKDVLNEPKNVVHTIKKMAEIKGYEEKEIENSVFMNFQKLFL